MPGNVTINPSSLALGEELAFVAFEVVTLTNNGSQPVIVSGYTIGGSNPSQFAALNMLVPSKIQPGGTLQVTVSFWAPDTNSYSATLTFQCQDGSTPSVSLTGEQTTPSLGSHDSLIIFKPSVISAGLWNQSGSTLNTTITCENIGPGLCEFTNYVSPSGPITLTGLPSFPFTLTDTESFTFTLEWGTPNPVVIGQFYYEDISTGFVISNLSGGTNYTGNMIGGGFFADIIPVGPLNGVDPQTWFGIHNGVMAFEPTDLNCEYGASLTRIYDLGIPIYEKKLCRWAVRYENLGVAQLNLTVTSVRGTPIIGPLQISIGDLSADGTVRTAYFDFEISAELFKVVIATAAAGGSGPVSIVDMYPQYVPAGEYVENT